MLVAEVSSNLFMCQLVGFIFLSFCCEMKYSLSTGHLCHQNWIHEPLSLSLSLSLLVISISIILQYLIDLVEWFALSISLVASISSILLIAKNACW